MKKVIITEKEYRILKEMGENLESLTQDEADFLEKTYGINVPYSEFFSKVHDVVARVLKIGNIPGTNMRYEPDSDVFHNYVKNAVKEYLKIQESQRSHRVNMNEVRRDIRGKRLVHHDESNTVDKIDDIVRDEVEFYEREYVLTIPHSMFVKKVRDVVNRAIKIKHYLPDSDEFKMFVFDDLYDYFGA